MNDKDVWLASTDADSTVHPDWLAPQLSVHKAGHTVWVGTVSVEANETTPDVLGYQGFYSLSEGPAHPHVHAANLGIRADTYKRDGWFCPVRTGDDHDFLNRLDPSVDVIARGTKAPVMTSSRLYGRAPHGIVGFLRNLFNVEVDVDVAVPDATRSAKSAGAG